MIFKNTSRKYYSNDTRTFLVIQFTSDFTMTSTSLRKWTSFCTSSVTNSPNVLQAV